MIHAAPAFDTRQDAETYAEDLAMKGYERSMGFAVRVCVERNEDGLVEYVVRMTRCRTDD